MLARLNGPLRPFGLCESQTKGRGSMPTRSVDLEHLRSIVLAGHAGAGKTTLAEQLLFRTGAISRLGRVDDGTASLDLRARGAEAPRVALAWPWRRWSTTARASR